MNFLRCAAEHMASVRVEMSTTLENLLDKLTALEQYEETLTDVMQVSSVDLLSQVCYGIYFNLFKYNNCIFFLI